MHPPHLLPSFLPWDFVDKRKLQQELDERELQEFKDACASPHTDGVAFAAEILEAAQSDVKEQFKEAFVELKEALEVTEPSR